MLPLETLGAGATLQQPALHRVAVHPDGLFPQPPLYDRSHVSEFGSTQRVAFPNAMPFCETSPAARRGAVLRDEHRMSLEGRLFAVINRACRSQAL
jgi:hypothetical protein